MAINIHSGKSIWSYHTSIATTRSLIYDSKSKNIIALLSAYNRGADDSIICYTMTGQVKSRTGFKDSRIISNLCLCGKEKDRIAFGYLKVSGIGDSERTMHVAAYSGLQSGNVQKTSDHKVSYFATKISSNGPVVLSAGFYSNGGELESGIDAFYADDTTKLWQRHFTYPIVTPVGVSSKYAYFTLTFSTEALVPARSIFYTLDLSTGKTLGELSIAAATEAAVNGIPMPMSEKGFMFSSPGKPHIYFLKP
jgi:outer membrane protein assembly factor BamB